MSKKILSNFHCKLGFICICTDIYLIPTILIADGLITQSSGRYKRTENDSVVFRRSSNAHRVHLQLPYHLFWEINSFLLYTIITCTTNICIYITHTSYTELMQQGKKKAEKALIGNLFHCPQIRLVILVPKRKIIQSLAFLKQYKSAIRDYFWLQF